MRQRHAWGTLLTAVAALAAPALVSCRFDPVPQEIIDDLGPEQGTPDEKHRAGQPCVVCHGTYGGVAPQMWFGGTLYKLDGETISPAAGVKVTFFDASGNSAVAPPSACSNEAGNFFLPKSDVEEVVYPVKVVVGSRAMTSLIGRDGSCATCHKHPDRFDPADPPLNSTTGANHDSAGVVLVLDADDLGTCP
jgi:hypothetical protein